MIYSIMYDIEEVNIRLAHNELDEMGDLKNTNAGLLGGSLN